MLESMDKKSIKNSRFSILYFLLVIWVVYVSDSMLFSLNNNRPLMTYSRFTLIFAGMACFLYMCIRNRLRMNAYLAIVSVLMLITSIFYSGTFYIFLSKFATIMVGYCVANFFDTNKFVKYYIHLMVLIALASILGYLFPEFFTALPLPQIVTSTRQNTFVCAFLTNVPTQIWVQRRNYGPFWEPGAFEAFLNITIFFILFVSEMNTKKKILFIAICTIAIITTFSTTGLMALPFFLIAYIFKVRKGLNNLGSRIIVGTLLIAAIIYILGDSGIFSTHIILKLQNEDSSRFLFPRYAILAGLRNPILGIGGQAESVIQELSGGRVLSFTNTIIAHFLRFGILVTVYYVVQNYKMIKSIVDNNFLSLLLCVTGFAILLSGEYYFYSPLFAFLMFYRFQPYKDIGENYA